MRKDFPMTTIRRIGNSLGLTIDRDTLRAAGLRAGDQVTVTVVAGGRLVVQAVDAETARPSTTA
jgi:antitoxin component of MazEF toxin-antitoxin module